MPAQIATRGKPFSLLLVQVNFYMRRHFFKKKIATAQQISKCLRVLLCSTNVQLPTVHMLWALKIYLEPSDESSIKRPIVCSEACCFSIKGWFRRKPVAKTTLAFNLCWTPEGLQRSPVVRDRSVASVSILKVPGKCCQQALLSLTSLIVTLLLEDSLVHQCVLRACEILQPERFRLQCLLIWCLRFQR